MNILDRCRSIRVDIDRYSKLSRADTEARVFRERATEVRLMYGAIRESLDKRRVFLAKKTLSPKVPALSRQLELIREYRDSIATSGQDSGKAYGLLKRSINRFAADMTASIVATLENLKAEMPSVEEPFLKAVERIPGYEDKVAGIRAKRIVLTGGRATEAMNANDIAAFLDARSQLAALADELRPAEFPQEVLDFFQAVRRGGVRGAPLEQLTEPVRKWLLDHNLLQNVRIILT
jgi:hypothetical protein